MTSLNLFSCNPDDLVYLTHVCIIGTNGFILIISTLMPVMPLVLIICHRVEWVYNHFQTSVMYSRGDGFMHNMNIYFGVFKQAVYLVPFYIESLKSLFYFQIYHFYCFLGSTYLHICMWNEVLFCIGFYQYSLNALGFMISLVFCKKLHIYVFNP